jgi:hypothetical protein
MRNRLLLHPTRGPLHLSGLLLAACLGGCQEEEAAQAPSLLIGGWQVVKVESDTPDTTWEVREDCTSDDIDEFTLDGTYTRVPGRVLCEGQSGPLLGGWRISDDETTLFLTYDGIFGEYESEIAELTEARLITVFDSGQLDGTRFRYTYNRIWGL